MTVLDNDHVFFLYKIFKNLNLYCYYTYYQANFLFISSAETMKFNLNLNSIYNFTSLANNIFLFSKVMEHVFNSNYIRNN